MVTPDFLLILNWTLLTLSFLLLLEFILQLNNENIKAKSKVFLNKLIVISSNINH